MMKRPYLLFILLMAFMSALIPLCTAEQIIFEPASLTISQGDTGVITITLDKAPKGLAGYLFHVSVTNPGTARIMDVSYPPWAGLSDTTGTPGESITMSAVDLMRTIEPGATNVLLGTISVQGGTAGAADISIGEIQMDADGGDMIVPAVQPGSISVTTGGIPVTWTTSPTTVQTTVPVSTTITTVPPTTSSGSSSSSDSGSGSSGGSFVGGGGSGSTVTSTTTIPELTSTVEVTTPVTEVQAAATADVQGMVTTQTQALSGPAETPETIAATARQQSSIPGAGMVPGGTGPVGIPWLYWAIVAILVIISLILLYLAVTKKI